jgi:NADPH:quinone reductase-like Zn-dependent oxidoreductase
LELADVEVGLPGADEVVIAVEAAPVHIADLLYIAGELPIAPPAPAIAGIEGVGRVIACGGAVSTFAPGDRVFLPRKSGTWARQVRHPAARLLPAPAHGDPMQLALVPINAPTAWFLLQGVVALQRGDWLIQNAANSSCGRFIIGIAKQLGLRTINIVRRVELLDELRLLGGDIVLLDGPHLDGRELTTQVAEATKGAPLRLAIDAVAGAATQKLAACLTRDGVIACYGRMSGEPCQVSPETLYLQNLALRGFFTPYFENPLPRDEWLAIMQRLARWVADGVLQARIAASYPLSRIHDALRHEMQTGAQREGKVIVLPQQ